MTISGPRMFARFAYPPNQLGYCGPDDSRALLEQLDDDRADPFLRDTARRFEGAWPYLGLIAASNRIADPLEPRVVEAYWIGNSLLDAVGPAALGDSLEERFRRVAGPRWAQLVAAVPAQVRPHHNFHVFGVYPWVGLVRSGVVDQPLRVLDRCRIRWGTVQAVYGDCAVVSSRPLEWDGRALALGLARPEQVLLRVDGHGLAPDVHDGDRIAMHWDWACGRLSARQQDELARRTRVTLDVVNGLPRPAPAALLG